MMFKILLLISGMFATLQMGDSTIPLADYVDFILAGFLALLISPWVANQFE